MAIAVLLLMALGIPAVSAGQTPVTRDSAGIRIIENERPAVGGDGRWAVVDSEPTLTIGQLDGPQPYLFSSVDRAYEAAGGRIVVADAGDLMSSHEVRVFDDQGSHMVTFGGVGEGPGEFIVGPVIRLVHPDTILAWDPRSRRFSWFGLDGELLMERTVRSPALPLLMHPTPWSLVPGGGVVVLDLPVGRAEFNGVATREASLFILPAGSTDLETIELQAWTVVAGGDGWDQVGLYPNTAWAVRTTDPPVVVSSNAQGDWELSLYGTDGVLKSVVRASISRMDVTEALAARQREYLLRRVEGNSSYSNSTRAALRSAIRSMALPEQAPAIGGEGAPASSVLLVDASDRLWVKRWSSDWIDSATNIYDVVDAQGRWLGWVEVPSSWGSMVSIGEDHVLFKVTDSLGVPQVRRHPLERRTDLE